MHRHLGKQFVCLIKSYTLGDRDGLAVKSAAALAEDPSLVFRTPRGSSQPSLTPVPLGDPVLSSDFCVQHTYMGARARTHKHNINKNIFLKVGYYLCLFIL